MAFKTEKHGMDEVFIKWPEDNPEAKQYFYRGHKHPTLEAAKAAIDEMMGPDVVGTALANIGVPYEWSQEGTVTKAQRRVLYQLAREIKVRGGLGERYMAEYEFKEFKLDWGAGNDLYLVAEMGRKNDEGTMGSIICRDRWHISVGPRGGCINMNAKRYSKKRRGIFNCVNWGRTSFGGS